MCEQCTTEALRYGELIPGWFLMRAQKDGNEWKAGEWGLVRRNDPLTTWTSTPTPNPAFGLDDDAETALWKANEDNEIGRRIVEIVPDDFDEAFDTFDPRTGYKLVAAAMQRGYNPEKSGSLSYWLFDLMGEFLKTAQPVHHGAEA